MTRAILKFTQLSSFAALCTASVLCIAGNVRFVCLSSNGFEVFFCDSGIYWGDWRVNMGYGMPPLEFPVVSLHDVDTRVAYDGKILYLNAIGVSSLLLFFTSMLTRVRRFGPNQCQTCGYLCIGNSTQICPECGNPKSDYRDSKKQPITHTMGWIGRTIDRRARD